MILAMTILELELELEQALELELEQALEQEQEQEPEPELEQELVRNLSIAKKDLAANISNKLRLSNKDSLSIVMGFINFCVKNKDKNINIHNFGSFLPKHSPKRIGRNPKTKEEFIIKKRTKFSFKPSDKIKKVLN